jgi:hypothetical protein
MTAADERQRRREPRHRAETVEKIILRPKDDRRPRDNGRALHGAHALFALGLGASVMRRRVRIGRERRDMNQRRADGARCLGHGFRALRHQGVEALPAALEHEADEIDRDIGVAQSRSDRIGIAQIGLHGMNLADPAHRLQIAGEPRPPYRDTDPVSPVGQRPHHVAAEEARAPEHCDQSFKLALRAHASRNTRWFW